MVSGFDVIRKFKRDSEKNAIIFKLYREILQQSKVAHVDFLFDVVE